MTGVQTPENTGKHLSEALKNANQNHLTVEDDHRSEFVQADQLILEFPAMPHFISIPASRSQ